MASPFVPYSIIYFQAHKNAILTDYHVKMALVLMILIVSIVHERCLIDVCIRLTSLFLHPLLLEVLLR